MIDKVIKLKVRVDLDRKGLMVLILMIFLVILVIYLAKWARAGVLAKKEVLHKGVLMLDIISKFLLKNLFVVAMKQYHLLYQLFAIAVMVVAHKIMKNPQLVMLAMDLEKFLCNKVFL